MSSDQIHSLGPIDESGDSGLREEYGVRQVGHPKPMPWRLLESEQQIVDLQWQPFAASKGVIDPPSQVRGSDQERDPGILSRGIQHKSIVHD
jgi:hypothetical protein